MLAKAESLAGTKKYKEAETLVRQVIQANPAEDAAAQAPAYNTLGDCLRAANRPKEALIAYLHTDLLYSKDKEEHPAGPSRYRAALPPAQAGCPGRRVRAAAQAGVSSQPLEPRRPILRGAMIARGCHRDFIAHSRRLRAASTPTRRCRPHLRGGSLIPSIRLRDRCQSREPPRRRPNAARQPAGRGCSSLDAQALSPIDSRGIACRVGTRSLRHEVDSRGPSAIGRTGRSRMTRWPRRRLDEPRARPAVAHVVPVQERRRVADQRVGRLVEVDAALFEPAAQGLRPRPCSTPSEYSSAIRSASPSAGSIPR